MFNLPLDSISHSCSFYDQSGELRFDPPVYQLRYTTVAQIIEHQFWEGEIKKVVEFGCSEMQFLNVLKRVKGLHHILQLGCMSKSPNQKTIKTEDPYEVWKNKTRVCDIGINCKLMANTPTVTRGTQFIASTTTRSTSTNGLLTKHNVGTIFPEVSFVSIDKILEYTTARLPEIIQPIEDPPFLMTKDKATQTENCAKDIKNKCLEKMDSGINFGKNEEILKYQCFLTATKNSCLAIDIDESKESYSALMAIQMKLTELCTILGKAFLKLVENKNKIPNKAYAAELNKHLLDLAVILQSNSGNYQYITPTAEILKRDYLELPMGERLAKAATKFQYCVDKTIFSSSDEIYADAPKHKNSNLENSEKSSLDQLVSPQVLDKAKDEFSELSIDKLRKRKSDLVDVVPLVVDTLKRVRYESNIGATLDCNLDDYVKKYTLTSNSLCGEQLKECQYENDDSNDEDFYGFSDSEYMLHVHNLESPASPIMCDVETPELSGNTTEIPLERISKSDYSPKSPKLVLNIEAEKTTLLDIPLNRILCNKYNSDPSQFSSFICKFLNKYNLSGRQKTNAKKVKKNVECLIIYKLRRVLETYLLTESMQRDVYKCVHRLLAITNNKRYFCYAIIEVIEDTEDKILVNYTPPAPSMTLTHQKILLLINKLNLSTNVFSSDFLKILDRHIFSFDSDKKCVSTLINLTLLFIGVADLCSLPLNSARIFIYKCLYFLNTKYIPMIFYVISAYPGVLPRAVDTSYFDDDALISSIQCALNCTVYAMENLEFKHREVFHILKYYYGYERVKPSREELVVNLLRRVLASQFKDVKYAFALICKRNNVNWVDQYVVRKNILQCLNELTSKLENSYENDEKIAFLLDTMSLILKCYPMDWDIRDFQDIFANLLYATDRNIIQEAAVDVDKYTLNQYSDRAKPLLCDYLSSREEPLHIEIYEGNIDTTNKCLEYADAVIGIEVIEHLYPGVFCDACYNIFGYIRPKIVVLTTPNFEFNVHFHTTLANGFRHHDHKFEWTRTQFWDWCRNICKRFPNYEFSIIGIGKGPLCKQNYGYATQAVVFVRKDIFEKPLTDCLSNNPIPNGSYDYKMLHSFEFPYAKNTKSTEQKLLDEIKYHIERFSNMEDKYYEMERNCFVIPLNDILPYIKGDVTLNALKDLITSAGYEIDDNNFLIIANDYYEESESSEDPNMNEMRQLEENIVEDLWE